MSNQNIREWDVNKKLPEGVSLTTSSGKKYFVEIDTALKSDLLDHILKNQLQQIDFDKLASNGTIWMLPPEAPKEDSE